MDPPEDGYRKGGFGDGGTSERHKRPSQNTPAALLFEDFVGHGGNSILRSRVPRGNGLSRVVDAI